MEPAETARHQGESLSTNLYVGNIPYDSTPDDLRAWFSDFGTVTGARVAADRETGSPRGFGFVEMADGAEDAAAALDGFRLDGRPLAVNVDAPPAARRRRRPAR
jgi:RNA recognition motif-containing protein